jgi:hypothetical protein
MGQPIGQLVEGDIRQLMLRALDRQALGIPLHHLSKAFQNRARERFLRKGDERPGGMVALLPQALLLRWQGGR